MMNTTYQGLGTLTHLALNYATTNMFTQAKGVCVRLEYICVWFVNVLHSLKRYWFMIRVHDISTVS